MKTMIKYLLILHLMSILALPIANAQIQNGNFQTFDGGCADDESLSSEETDHDDRDEELNDDSQFQDECSDYWFSTHGSPQIMTTGENNTRWGLMWSQWSDSQEDFRCEGIAQYCSFSQHREYWLTLDIRNRDTPAKILDNAHFYLANGLVTGEDNQGFIPDFTNREEAWNEANILPTSSFWNLSINFSPEDNSYDWFWIYPTDDVDNVGETRWFEIDNLVAGTCPTTETYNNTSSLPHATDRSSWVKTTSGGSGVDVLNNQEVHFHAGSYVLLDVDFHAQNGSTFHAMIDGCKSWECSDPNNKTDHSQTQNGQDLDYELQLSEVTEEEDDSKDDLPPNPSLQIYPNPNSGNFTIELSTGAQASVFVMDMLGKVIYKHSTENVSNNRLDVDISDHPKGVYLVKVIQGDEVLLKRMIHQ